MRNKVITAMIAGSLALGGCTAGYGYDNDPIGGILGGIFGGGGGYDNNRNLSQFERAAVDACGREASRYGRIQITDVRQQSRDVVEVFGRIDSRDRDRDEFRCAFRSDGRIVDFRRG